LLDNLDDVNDEAVICNLVITGIGVVKVLHQLKQYIILDKVSTYAE